MTVEPDGTGGWFVHWQAGTFFHVTSEWCDQMWRHQYKKRPSPAFNYMRYLVEEGSGTAEIIGELFGQAQRDLSGAARTTTMAPEFEEWMRNADIRR